MSSCDAAFLRRLYIANVKNLFFQQDYLTADVADIADIVRFPFDIRRSMLGVRRLLWLRLRRV